MPDDLLIAILAAGASRRLGQPKQLVSLNGETLLHRQCRVAHESGLGPVGVVLGCQFDACATAIADLPVAVVRNEQWEEGLAASVRCAAQAAIDGGAAALMLLQCDQYRITSADLRSLHHAWRATPANACFSADGDYVGPPAIVPAAMFPDLLSLRGEQGARAIFRNGTRASPAYVTLPNASFDLDDAAQLKALLAVKPSVSS
ncbi:MAG TPA: nucleotidyltransferase family protein [Tepidisphaeraceae bacterium]|jgi:molybdenum cofactor cytidylyltransferase|nr:nucleotidyltransferase family protein [Tepidisphaeraceae bacterium]